MVKHSSINTLYLFIIHFWLLDIWNLCKKLHRNAPALLRSQKKKVCSRPTLIDICWGRLSSIRGSLLLMRYWPRLTIDSSSVTDISGHGHFGSKTFCVMEFLGHGCFGSQSRVGPIWMYKFFMINLIQCNIIALMFTYNSELIHNIEAWSFKRIHLHSPLCFHKK